MFAIVETGGKQFKVSLGESIKVDKLDAQDGSDLTLDRVLLISDDGKVRLGSPYIGGASVKAEVLGVDRYKKVLVFKQKTRKGYRRLRGHRQHYTKLRIKEIISGS